MSSFLLRFVFFALGSLGYERNRGRSSPHQRKQVEPRESSKRPPMVDFSTGHLMAGTWHHQERTAETNSAVVVARREETASRRGGPAKDTAKRDNVCVCV